MKNMLFYIFFILFLTTITNSQVQDSLSYIIIRTAPNGGGNEFGDHTMTADESVVLYAAGYDENDNYIGDIVVSWISTGTLDLINASSSVYTFSPVKAPTSGSIIATTGPISDITATITVNLGVLCYIRIKPEFESLTVVIGEIPNFYIGGYDCDGNYRGSVTASWAYIEGLDISKPSCGRIVATSGEFSDTSGVICVIENTISYIQIRNVPIGAGKEVGDWEMTADDSITLYCAAYDSLNQYVADINAEWYSTGSLEDINATGANFTFNPVKAPAIGSIIALSGSRGDVTGTIIVNLGALHHITINSSSGEDGIEVGDFTLTVGHSISLYAAGYDSDNNYISPIEAEWLSTGNLDPISGTGTSYTFTPITGPASGTIIASYNDYSDVTGTIIILYCGLHYIKILMDYRDCYLDTTIYMGDTLTFRAAGYDAGDNYMGDFTIDWSDIKLTGTLSGNTLGGTGSSWSFVPSDTGKGRIIFGDIDTTGIITVIHNPLDITFDKKNPPIALELYQNHPNPFNPSTKIKFTLPKPETVKIEVYNIIGQKIETLLNKPMPAGYHEVEFNGQNLSSGVYLYRLEAGNWQYVKKMILLK